jgi:hypothetical protein
LRSLTGLEDPHWIGECSQDLRILQGIHTGCENPSGNPHRIGASFRESSQDLTILQGIHTGVENPSRNRHRILRMLTAGTTFP